MSRNLAASMTLCLATFAGGVCSQEIRYDLGLRVRAFERAFESKLADLEVRRRVCPALERAVTSFFSMRLSEVARNMDRAHRLLSDGEAVSDAERWARSVSLRLRRRLLDVDAREIAFELRSLYRVDAELPEGARLRLSLVGRTGKSIGKPSSFTVDALPFAAKAAIDVASPGDHRLVVALYDDQKLLARHEQGVSFVRSLDARIATVREYAKVQPTDTRSATARGLARLLQSLARKRTSETDIPAALHLADFERIVAKEGESPRGHLRRVGDSRVWFQRDATTWATRVFVPAKPAADSMPLVIALHGAGGTENLFFEGYGAGKIVGLCETRGWMLVAPRGGFGRRAGLPGFLDAVALHYPIDRTRVFAVGHSMGAAQLMSAASAHPERLRAIAALGGSGSVRRSDALRGLPVFVAPGKRDFALRGARRLRDALAAAGVETVAYREYEAVEHLAIVQVALGDVFAFFDRFVGAK